MGVEDERLVRLIARGDRASFDELYRRTAPWLLVRLRWRCADDDLVAEVMQDTYLAVWRAAGAFTGTATGTGTAGSVAGWVWTIAARRLVDAFRRRAHDARRPAVPMELVPGADAQVLAGVVGDQMGEARGGSPRSCARCSPPSCSTG